MSFGQLTLLTLSYGSRGGRLYRVDGHLANIHSIRTGNIVTKALNRVNVREVTDRPSCITLATVGGRHSKITVFLKVFRY